MKDSSIHCGFCGKKLDDPNYVWSGRNFYCSAEHWHASANQTKEPQQGILIDENEVFVQTPGFPD
jgi:hypothetical protein